MSFQQSFKVLSIILIVPAMVACAPAYKGQIFRGGVPVYDSPLRLKEPIALRLVEKWRLTFSWIGGPAEIDPCRFGRNVFNRLNIGGVLANETRAVRFEKDGILGYASEVRGQLYFIPELAQIYGTNSHTGKFEGYSAFCKHTFQDIWTGMSVFLVKPDTSKGTDEWIAGAKPVTINGLYWLRKDIPIEDYSQNRKKWAAPIEIWVLKIPDTPYWFMMQIGGSTGGVGTAPGSNRNPEKFAQVLDLFHQMVASVKLEPITPIDTSTLNIQSKP